MADAILVAEPGNLYNILESLDCHVATHFMRAAGTSAHASEGDVLAVDCAEDPKLGRLAIVVQGGEFRLRRLKHEDTEQRDRGDGFVVPHTADGCEIWGMVAAVRQAV